MPASPHGRKPKPVTTQRLENSAVFYLGRFSSSSENLRRVLMRRVQRAEELDAAQKAGFAAFIDQLIIKFQAQGYLNDAAYVEGQVRSLRRQGASSRGIAMKLRAKGAQSEDIGAELERSDASDADAAWIFARRRRLGPYREEAKRTDHRQKDMAAMGRAGFDYQTARAVIDAAEVDTDR